jgi:hypothetical protein
MFVNEFIFSFSLLLFAALLCLLGAALLIDGITRFAREEFKQVRAKPAREKKPEAPGEIVTNVERAA